MNPYRDGLLEARERIRRGREQLRAQAVPLANERRELPRAMRQRLEMLEAELNAPIDNHRHVAGAEAVLSEYRELLGLAREFSAQLVRARRVQQPDRRSRWAMVIGVTLPLLVCGGYAAGEVALSKSAEHLALRPPYSAQSAADCTKRSYCQVPGGCSFDETTQECVRRGTLNPCGLSAECFRHGRCNTDPQLGCVIGTEEECRNSTDCQNQGLCSLSQDSCVASKDADCRSSQNCRTVGSCWARAGACVDKRSASF